MYIDEKSFLIKGTDEDEEYTHYAATIKPADLSAAYEALQTLAVLSEDATPAMAIHLILDALDRDN